MLYGRVFFDTGLHGLFMIGKLGTLANIDQFALKETIQYSRRLIRKEF